MGPIDQPDSSEHERAADHLQKCYRLAQERHAEDRRADRLIKEERRDDRGSNVAKSKVESSEACSIGRSTTRGCLVGFLNDLNARA